MLLCQLEHTCWGILSSLWADWFIKCLRSTLGMCLQGTPQRGVFSNIRTAITIKLSSLAFYGDPSVVWAVNVPWDMCYRLSSHQDSSRRGWVLGLAGS